MTLSKISPAIFLLSFSALSYEIALTRIFSISLWYHFAFMVISIACWALVQAARSFPYIRNSKTPQRFLSTGSSQAHG